MEAKHTPGPWEVNGYRDSDEGLTVEARGGEVAFIASTTGYAHADIANAFLIAAAPDMLTLIETAIFSIEHTHESCPNAPCWKCDAEALVRKAKGVEQS
jgi:hypothetical protein